MSNIVLCGIKHSGKSTQGKLLAMIKSREFVDSDTYLENLHVERSGKSEKCREIFQNHGEEYFRQLEAEALERIAEDDSEDKVIALGGGVADNPFLDESLWKKLGVLIFLDIEPRAAFERITALGLPPFLATMEPYEEFIRIYMPRREKYLELADHVVEIGAEATVEEVAGKIRRIVDELEL